MDEETVKESMAKQGALPLDISKNLAELKANKISQKKDKFILDYMNFLGHNEFGLNYKSWNLSEKYENPFTLNHWLEQWCFFYKNII